MVPLPVVAVRQTGGLLVLSELAGASQELSETLLVNPHNKEQIASSLAAALAMPEEEQRRRNEALRGRLRRYDVTTWAEQFLAALARTKKAQAELAARRLPPGARRRLRHDYRAAEKRLLLLDYDGTLVPFAPRPEYAQPDAEVIRLLRTLSRNEHNVVVILSGRRQKTLETWLGFLNVALVAEHGAWIKEHGKTWSSLEPLRNDWKTHLRPIIESYADSIPGSFVEEKDFSLSLHYRTADPELAALRTGQFKDDLCRETVNLGLEILEGNKVLEVRNADVNKGRAALRFLERSRWDFILAVGDDRTDEDVFEVLPAGAYSIKVKLEPSHARFNVDSVSEVRTLLRHLTR
jgi:trehalose 6-phosphate synthase/phosphatase